MLGHRRPCFARSVWDWGFRPGFWAFPLQSSPIVAQSKVLFCGWPKPKSGACLRPGSGRQQQQIAGGARVRWASCCLHLVQVTGHKMVRHNNVIPNGHWKKKWQFRVRTWFNQPARKLKRRKGAWYPGGPFRAGQHLHGLPGRQQPAASSPDPYRLLLPPCPLPAAACLPAPQPVLRRHVHSSHAPQLDH